MAGYSGFGANFGALENSETVFLAASTAIVQASLMLSAVPKSFARIFLRKEYNAAFKGD